MEPTRREPFQKKYNFQNVSCALGCVRWLVVGDTTPNGNAVDVLGALFQYDRFVGCATPCVFIFVRQLNESFCYAASDVDAVRLARSVRRRTLSGACFHSLTLFDRSLFLCIFFQQIKHLAQHRFFFLFLSLCKPSRALTTTCAAVTLSQTCRLSCSISDRTRRS